MTRKLRYLIALVFVSLAGTAFAQSGAITGTIFDEKKEPMIGAVVQVLEGNVVKGGAVTDVDGIYLIKPLSPGRYDVKVSYSSYKTDITNGVIVSVDKNTKLDVTMEMDTKKLNEVVVKAYKIPLIDPYADGRSSRTSDEIEKMPVRTTDAVAATTGGVYASSDGLKIQGGRTDATVYIIDGVQVRGGAGKNLAQNSIDQIDIMTSGLSAKYGDAIGGVVSITTKGFSDRLRGNILAEHSVEGYNHNLANFTLSGPLYSKKTTEGKKPLVGFFLGADGIYDKDPRPVYGGTYKVKDDVLKQIQEHPLVPTASSTGTPTLKYASEYVRADDLEIQKARSNAEQFTGRINAKLDFQLADNLNLTAGGNYTYDRSSQYGTTSLGYYTWSLFAGDKIPRYTTSTGRGYLRLTQRFGKTPTSAEGAEQKKPLISNAYYQVQADYQTETRRSEDPNHKDNLFKYGYVGKFNTEYATEYLANQVDDTTGLTGVIYQGSRRATKTTFERSDINPLLANYTSDYFNYAGKQPATLQEIQAGNGMVNGQLPFSTYQLWASSGNGLSGYNYAQLDQFAVSVDASFDLQPGKVRHSIEFGLQYQQRVERSYATFGATNGGGLWQYMRLQTNKQIQLDKENPVLIVNGKQYTKEQWRAGLVSFSPLDTIFYNYVAIDSAQSTFDKNLRAKLGKGATEFINIDAYDPNTYSLSMFSADELLNQGNSFVGYYGYDYTGKKQKGQVNFNDFFTKKDANGNYTRDIGAYKPNYIAGYILDKFSFKDINFNIGLRVDRFDNNTKVLKDPYSLYEVNQLGAVRSKVKNDFNGGVHPGNIGDDYVVYVNSNETQNPTVIGYRNGDDWFDPYGRQIEDPTALKAYSNGRDPQPYLVNKTTRIQDSTFDPNSSFTDYKPQVNVMPRIKFSFPISDVALFYAHYDVVVQRPRTGAYATPISYYFLEQNDNSINSNSNLKPEKMFDYEVGFQQKVTDQSSLKLSAFYRERKDMIQVRAYLYAFPKTYYTFGNRDFSTTKGLKLEYDLRRMGNIRMNIAYTLQFAEGSGSGTASSNGGSNTFLSPNGLLQSFIQANLPNLRFSTPLDYDSRHQIVATVDYHFDEGNGPVVGNQHILQNAGVNFIFSARSGEPYTKIAQPATRVVDGSLNGARLPWHYNLDLRIDKDFKLAFGKKQQAEGVKAKEPLILNAYVLIYNVLNTRDVLSVNGYTSRPDDDGFLTSPTGISLTNNQTDPQSYIDLYRISNGVNGDMNTIGAVNLPRRINLGLQLNF